MVEYHVMVKLGLSVYLFEIHNIHQTSKDNLWTLLGTSLPIHCGIEQQKDFDIQRAEKRAVPSSQILLTLS